MVTIRSAGEDRARYICIYGFYVCQGFRLDIDTYTLLTDKSYQTNLLDDNKPPIKPTYRNCILTPREIHKSYLNSHLAICRSQQLINSHWFTEDNWEIMVNIPEFQ